MVPQEVSRQLPLCSASSSPVMPIERSPGRRRTLTPSSDRTTLSASSGMSSSSRISASAFSDTFHHDQSTIRDSFCQVETAGEAPTKPSKMSLAVLTDISASRRIAILPKRQWKLPLEGGRRCHDRPSRLIERPPSSRFPATFAIRTRPNPLTASAAFSSAPSPEPCQNHFHALCSHSSGMLLICARYIKLRCSRPFPQKP